MTKETIFSLITAQGRAGVGIIRLSGPMTFQICAQLVTKMPAPHKAALRNFSFEGELLDQGLLIIFPAPESFTGEDCAEFHLHGSEAVYQLFYQIFQKLGARLAKAGEFSKRAFENNRLDLTQAEAIADLIDAQTDAQRRQALSQMGGAMKKNLEGFRETLQDMLAELEAIVDFPDEDLPAHLWQGLLSRASSLQERLLAALSAAKSSVTIRSGFNLVLAGAPNAGKSSLFNALVQENLAIVTPQAGTTRDVLRERLTIGGYQLNLFDTAGLRDSTDLIEQEGIRRALLAQETANLIFLVVDGSEFSRFDDKDFTRQNDVPTWLILNKSDVTTNQDNISHTFLPYVEKAFSVSCTTGEGIGALMEALSDHLKETLSLDHPPFATNARHLECLTELSHHLGLFIQKEASDVDLAAEDVRVSLICLDHLFGRTDVEVILDRIFSRFCIGK